MGKNENDNTDRSKDHHYDIFVCNNTIDVVIMNVTTSFFDHNRKEYQIIYVFVTLTLILSETYNVTRNAEPGCSKNA